MERDSLHTAGDDTAIIPQLAEDHFDVVMRGYDRRQVDERVSLLRGRAQELERRLEAAQNEAGEAWREVENSRRAATQAAPTAQQLGDRVTGLLRLADEEAAARRTAAKAEADRVTREAEERAKRTITEAEERARKVIGQAEEKSRRSDVEARRRIDSLERHHSDLVQRMTRMRDVLIDLLGQDRSATEAAKPAPTAAPAGQPAGSVEESVRIVQSQPAGNTAQSNASAETTQRGAEAPPRRDAPPDRSGPGGPSRSQPPVTSQPGQRRG
jgi:cell division septum initiation protein DivIVA